MACEKICGTPMVFPYTQMLNIFLVLFVFTFPIPLAHVFWNEHSPINGYIITSQPRVFVPSTAGGHEFAGAVEDN